MPRLVGSAERESDQERGVVARRSRVLVSFGGPEAVVEVVCA